LPDLPPTSQTAVFPASLHLSLTRRLVILPILPLAPVRALLYLVSPSPGQELFRCCRFTTTALRAVRLLVLDRELAFLDSSGVWRNRGGKSETRHSEGAHSVLFRCQPKHHS